MHMLKRRCVGFNTTPYAIFFAAGELFRDEEVVVLLTFLGDDILVVVQHVE